MIETPKWKPYAEYTARNLELVVFDSRETKDAAIAMFFSKREFRKMPWAFIDGRRFVLPKGAASLLRRSGVRCTTARVRKSQLPDPAFAQELSRIQR